MTKATIQKPHQTRAVKMKTKIGTTLLISMGVETKRDS
jgi:hypothetical protein